MEVENYLLKVYENNKLSQYTILKIELVISDIINLLKSLNYMNFSTSNISFTSFGSYLNGFGTSTSDVDFTILTNCYIQDSLAIRAISQAIDKVLKEKKNKHFSQQYQIKEVLPNSRIPLIKLMDRSNNQELDLCINNILGAVNTRLLKAYADLHIKVAQGGILLKLWGKKQGIINKNDYSSYAITLMWICFLQREIGIPNLQNKKYKPQNCDSIIKIKRFHDQLETSFEVDTFFLYKGDQYNKFQEQCKELLDKIDLHVLLANFFQYYSLGGEAYKYKYLISIDKEVLRNPDTQVLYSISDPFDIEHDPGKKTAQMNQEKRYKFAESFQKFKECQLQEIQQLIS